MVDLVDINTNDPDINKYRIKLLRINTMMEFRGLLKSSNVTDIGYIIIYSEYYMNE